MVKPSTTYTATYSIDGTAQKTTIVTPATLDDAMRFTGTGTLSNFLLLEGDISNPPAFFSGMRSSFDQEYDEEKGKWKVNIKVVGKNKFDGKVYSGWVTNEGIEKYPVGTRDNVITDVIRVNKNTNYTMSGGTFDYVFLINDNFTLGETLINNYTFNTGEYNYVILAKSIRYQDIVESLYSKLQIEQGDTATEYEPYTYNDITIYINEPLRKGDIIRAENRKILVERHMGEVILDGSDDEEWHKIYFENRKLTTLFYMIFDAKKISDYNLCSKVYCNNFSSVDVPLNSHDYEGSYTAYDGNICLSINNSKLKTLDIVSFKQYLSQNPVTIVYQLASPVIEEVETDYTRLMLESYENATVYFNSHIFPTSTIRYQANVISTAEIMAVNNEQDMLLIDSATEIAVIKLTM